MGLCPNPALSFRGPTTPLSSPSTAQPAISPAASGPSAAVPPPRCSVLFSVLPCPPGVPCERGAASILYVPPSVFPKSLVSSLRLRLSVRSGIERAGWTLPASCAGFPRSFVSRLTDRRTGANRLVSPPRDRALRNVPQLPPKHLLFPGGAPSSPAGGELPTFTSCCWKENACLFLCPG